MEDFEDAIVSHCADRMNIDYIITRNGKDFTASPVHAITPENFLARFLAG
jgi:hypothetical protein